MISSRFHRSLIQCPKCLNDIDAVIWDVINADTDPDLKERLLLKIVQQQVCQNCGNDFVLAEPLLYCEPEHKLMIACIPETAEEADEISDNSASAAADGRKNVEKTADVDSPDLSAAINPADLPDWHFRRFSDYNSLIETIHIYDHFCDDRLMAIVKVAIRTQGNLEPPTVDIRFLTADDTLMRFLAQSDSGDWFTVDYPTEIYLNTEAMFQKALPPEAGWLSPDSAFAASLIRKQTAEMEKNVRTSADAAMTARE